jgi:NAD(P)-dependent dehydrogenase (short-subunit alcohol dehydrogenase family)
VKEILRGHRREETSRFIAFRSHWRFQSEFCNPARGNEKGGVEGEGGYFRRNHWVPLPEARDLDELNAYRSTRTIRCDVTDEQQVREMVDKTVVAFGRLDAAFNNAGVQSPAIETADASSEEFDRVTAINLKSVWICMKYELQQMRKQGSGAIVNNSSIGGLIGLPGRAIYHAVKHGVIGLTKSAALEYAAKGITVNAVCPGTIDTPMVAEMIAKDPQAMENILKMQPIGRLGKAEEVASAVLWLCSPGAAFVVGHALAVDGGFTAQ